jgi:hypothetical protein
MVRVNICMSPLSKKPFLQSIGDLRAQTCGKDVGSAAASFLFRAFKEFSSASLCASLLSLSPLLFFRGGSDICSAILLRFCNKPTLFNFIPVGINEVLIPTEVTATCQPPESESISSTQTSKRTRKNGLGHPHRFRP